jgi:hypothetical protein
MLALLLLGIAYGSTTPSPVTSNASPCLDDEGCSLNGLCQAGVCKCFAPWSGPLCGVLDALPAPRSAVYGVNCVSNCSAPHTKSWGGNVVHAGGSYHLFVSQLTQNCPLRNWMTNMDVAHAVSDSPLGPFQQRDFSLPPFSTNPHAIVDEKGEWWLFHIGSGDNHTNQTHCQPSNSGEAGPMSPPPPPGVVHQAQSPNGPWSSRPSVDCNNPSPALAKLGTNGTKREARLMCDSGTPSGYSWSIQRSNAGFGGPWERPLEVEIHDPRGGTL